MDWDAYQRMIITDADKTYNALRLDIELAALQLLPRERRQSMRNEPPRVRLARHRDLLFAFSRDRHLARFQVPFVHPRIYEPLRPEPAEERSGLDPDLVSRCMSGLLTPMPHSIALPDAVAPASRDEELDACLGADLGSLRLEERRASADRGDEDVNVLERVRSGRRSHVEGDDLGSSGSQSLVGVVVQGFLRAC
jgi:hypothetical protein